jgi:hypothetical protein
VTRRHRIDNSHQRITFFLSLIKQYRADAPAAMTTLPR